jgi:hypothetical protein
MNKENHISKKTFSKKIPKWIIIGTGFVAFFIIYKYFNPYNHNFFPECIFHKLTGYKCPGCGSQRAIHYLFNLDIENAFRENALLVISIPYIIVLFYFKMVSEKSDRQLKINKILLGNKALIVIIVSVLAFWILRNSI